MAEQDRHRAPAAGWLARHQVELKLSLRMIAAALLSFAAAQLVHATQAYWAVLTAIIVTQASVGGSLKAMLDRFVGTLGGAAWGVAVTIGLPHPDAVSTGLALTVALLPLVLLVAFYPAYRIAPVTAAIVLLGRLVPGGAVDAAFDRVLEIGLGSVVALGVALAIAPARAHQAVCLAARDALVAMAEQAAALLDGVAAATDAATVLAHHDRVRTAIERAAVAADEAARERRSYLSDVPDAVPLVRTLRRLSHDLVVIARALPAPLAEAVRVPLAEPASLLGAALAARMTGIAGALAGGAPLLPAAATEAAFDAYAGALAALRRDGLTRTLDDAEIERLFGLSFGLEQLRRNLAELLSRVAELALR